MESTTILLILSSVLHAFLGQPLETTEAWNTNEQPQCGTKEARDICTACSHLPPIIQVPSEACCSGIRTLKFCDVCLSDIESCLNVMKELDELAEFETENEIYNGNKEQALIENYDLPVKEPLEGIQEVLDVDYEGDEHEDDTRVKRFGRLFMKTPNRYERLIFGKRASGLDKRYGSLFINKSRWFGKRNGGSDSDVQKRYGPLFIGKSRNGWFGKRSEVNDESEAYDGDGSIFNKRYGPLFIGKGSYFGKRANSVVDKRFGRLFIGGRRNSWFG